MGILFAGTVMLTGASVYALMLFVVLKLTKAFTTSFKNVFVGVVSAALGGMFVGSVLAMTVNQELLLSSFQVVGYLACLTVGSLLASFIGLVVCGTRRV
jgi:drug/metabolite transporter superfamily protein YnfA